MSINLQKGQKINLAKEQTGLTSVIVGLGWDEAKKTRRWLAPKLQDIDCDAIAFLLGADGKIASTDDVVFFNKLKHKSGCVIHQGDNLTGAGEGDSEQIMVDLSHLPREYEKVVILVSIYLANQRNQHFGLIENAYVRLVDRSNNAELCKYNLSDNYAGMVSLIFGELHRNNGEWRFCAVGQPLNVWSVMDLAELYGLDKSKWDKK